MCRETEKADRPSAVSLSPTRRVVIFPRPRRVIFAKIFRAAEASTRQCVPTPGHGAARKEGGEKKNSQSNKAVSPSERLLAASGIKLQSHLEEKHERSDTQL